MIRNVKVSYLKQKLEFLSDLVYTLITFSNIHIYFRLFVHRIDRYEYILCFRIFSLSSQFINVWFREVISIVCLLQFGIGVTFIKTFLESPVYTHLLFDTVHSYYTSLSLVYLLTCWLNLPSISKEYFIISITKRELFRF